MAEYLRLVIDNASADAAREGSRVAEPPSLTRAKLERFGFTNPPSPAGTSPSGPAYAREPATAVPGYFSFATPPGFGSPELLVAMGMEAIAAEYRLQALPVQRLETPVSDAPLSDPAPLQAVVAHETAASESQPDGVGSAGGAPAHAEPPAVDAIGHDGGELAPASVNDEAGSSALSTTVHASPASPELLGLSPAQPTHASVGTDDMSHVTLVATSGADVLAATQGVATTFVFTGPPGAGNFDIYTGGEATTDTADFSQIAVLADAGSGPAIVSFGSNRGTAGIDGAAVSADEGAPAQDAGPGQGHGGLAPIPTVNGVYVDLAADGVTVDTADGPVTVQAWLLDGSGAAAIPLAHLDSIETVVGTAGNDIIVGSEAGNTFVYTAWDDAATDAQGSTVAGPAALYGFDIYDGGDGHSGLASQDASVAASTTGSDAPADPPPDTSTGTTSAAPAAADTGGDVDDVAPVPFASSDAQVISAAAGDAMLTAGLAAGDPAPDQASSESVTTAVDPADAGSPPVDAASDANPTGTDTSIQAPPDAPLPDLDTVDFGRLAMDLSTAGSVLLPDHSVGIVCDLEASVTVATVDPLTGNDILVTGSLVTTTGGDIDRPLALLVWADQETTNGDTVSCSTIEGIAGSQGSDVLLGDAQDNVFINNSQGTDAVSYYDGRDGSDTASFERYDDLDSDGSGIAVTLSDRSSSTVDSSGTDRQNVVSVYSVDDNDGSRSVVAYLDNIENIVGTKKNDWLQGDEANNVLTGGKGADSFVFVASMYPDGTGAMLEGIGHDSIADFNSAEGDVVVLSNDLFGFDASMSHFDKIDALLAHATEQNGDLFIFIDASNSIELKGYDLDKALEPLDANDPHSAAIYDDFRFI